MTKNVLLIAYHWPPSNAAGTHRSLRFARHLRQFDWEPVVLTAARPIYQRYDPNLLNRVPLCITVMEAPHRDPWLYFLNWREQRLSLVDRQQARLTPLSVFLGNEGLLYRILKEVVSWLECRLYHPDIYMGWIKSAVAVALNNYRGSDFQAIYATGGPWSDFEVGYQLSRHWGIPLVLDFRDPWTIAYYSSGERRPQWAKARDRRRLACYLAAAQAVIFLHGTCAECYLSAFPRSLDDRKIHLIPNGFEAADMYTSPPARGECLSITYAGTLYSRKFDTLLSALSSLARQYNHQLKIKISFIGESQEMAIKIVKQLGLTSYIKFFPSMPFEETNGVMKDSHALLLLGEEPSAGYEIYATSKIFHYLSLGRPILGIMPPNEGKRLLQSLRAGLRVDVESITEIESALLTLYRAWENGSLSHFLPTPESLQPYIEPNLTAALVLALSGLPAQHPYRKGEAEVPPSLQHYFKRLK
jgi:hypothetical protein